MSAVRWLAQTGDTYASADSLRRVEAAVRFERLRRHLSRRQYEAIVLRFMFDLADEQIGQVMGLWRAAVRTDISGAVAALRKRPEGLDR